MCQIDLYQKTSLTMYQIFNSVTACISCSRISFLQFLCTFHIHIWNIFHIFQLFCCVYTHLLDTDTFCLLFFCPETALHCVLEPQIHVSLCIPPVIPQQADGERHACLFFPLLHPCKWSMHWSLQDPICYRKHGQATDVLLLLYCICEPFGQEYQLHTLFCCRTVQSRGLFVICSNVNCTVQYTQKQYILVDFSLIDCQGSTITIS